LSDLAANARISRCEEFPSGKSAPEIATQKHEARIVGRNHRNADPVKPPLWPSFDIAVA
jgi:hypothetical protein